MRIMGLDVGDKTIGVAASDPLGWTAQGIETIRRTNKKADYRRIGEIIEEKEITKIIVGIPKNMNGSLGPQGEKVLEFVEGLKNRFKIEIILWDERLTTVAAERMLISGDVSRKKRKKVIDMVAATYILQGYLDAQK
ncbi:Holliday junction resolvase RuvX [Crassaminicella indica]|uniref:Putative pre-16S rRNA nuclease n=1 Tax=Crassaminicella indica TaxID=2855394 RepID=A0ABX8RG83_9CLOT|nr:Holliday junction resolvase RuvX [Crassaminicella indica]QXM07472.1 Holliday junction resolvase RuvX [Crassaminicella indica]